MKAKPKGRLLRNRRSVAAFLVVTVLGCNGQNSENTASTANAEKGENTESILRASRDVVWRLDRETGEVCAMGIFRRSGMAGAPGVPTEFLEVGHLGCKK